MPKLWTLQAFYRCVTATLVLVRLPFAGSFCGPTRTPTQGPWMSLGLKPQDPKCRLDSGIRNLGVHGPPAPGPRVRTGLWPQDPGCTQLGTLQHPWALPLSLALVLSACSDRRSDWLHGQQGEAQRSANVLWAPECGSSGVYPAPEA